LKKLPLALLIRVFSDIKTKNCHKLVPSPKQFTARIDDSKDSPYQVTNLKKQQVHLHSLGLLDKDRCHLTVSFCWTGSHYFLSLLT